jgi:uncharacterized protein (DUF1330 family)
MPAYLIAQVEIRDPSAYTHYTARTPAIIAQYGGRILVRGGPIEPLEGEACVRRVVVIEFASMQAARAFYHSPEYQAAKRIRTPVSDAQLFLVQGV